MKYIQENAEFKVSGISKYLTETEKQKLFDLHYAEANLLELKNLINTNLHETKKVIGYSAKSGKFIRNMFEIDYDYSTIDMGLIFDLKNRKNLTICFRNSSNTSCKVCKVLKDSNGKLILKDGYPLLLIKFKYSYSKMTVNKFLDLVDKGDFHDITPYKFFDAYLKNYKESNNYKKNKAYYLSNLKVINTKLKNLKKELKQYISLYQERKQELKEEFSNLSKNVIKLNKQASLNKKQEFNNSVLKAKNIWNTIITKQEQAIFMNWFCKNIFSMRSYVLHNGASEEFLDMSYPDDIYGKKRRTQPLYNEKNELVSCDSISAYMSFKDIKDAPLDIILKLSNKTKKADLFKGNRLNDSNLTLFILNQYNKYGVKLAKINLNKYIDVENLKNTEFKDYLECFK